MRHSPASGKGRWVKPIERRRWAASLVFGVLIALLIGAGAFVLLVSQQ
jgi:hypothetical protein